MTYPVIDVTESTTAQDIFDAVAKHLLSQKRKALCPYTKWEENACRFRTTEGLACAVGCLLTDKEAQKLDNTSGGISALIYSKTAPERIHRFSQLLTDLQRLHDTSWPEVWPSRLMEMAITQGFGREVLEKSFEEE